jgi:hypothetical protein
MSEDCHNSNNAIPTYDGTQAVACHACGEPVKPEEAYLCELAKRDGTTEIAVFHGIDRLCPLKWALERLENIGGRLEAILALLGYCERD